jgi:hypothetical protein
MEQTLSWTGEPWYFNRRKHRLTLRQVFIFKIVLSLSPCICSDLWQNGSETSSRMSLGIEGWRREETWEYCGGDDDGFDLPIQFYFAMLVQNIAYGFMV